MHAPSEPPSSDSGAAVSAIEECDYLIERFRREASKNQKLAWSASIAIGFSSALIPVSIVVSTELGAFVFGKLMPSLLAALAAIAAGAAQLVRPHDRWRLNRRHQRLLEAERTSTSIRSMTTRPGTVTSSCCTGLRPFDAV